MRSLLARPARCRACRALLALLVVEHVEPCSKCSECVRANKACVNMSWVSLNRTREDLSSKVAKDEAMLAIVITRLLRNKKMLKEVDAKAKRKTQCLLSKVEKSNVAESFDCPAANALIGASPAIWSSLAMLDDFSSVGGISG